MKAITNRLYTLTANYGLIIIFVVFFMLEFYGKAFYFNGKTTIVQIYVKTAILGFVALLILLRIHKIKQVWLLLILPIFYILGQLSLINSFSTNSLIILVKFLTPLFFFILFTQTKTLEKYRNLTFRIFEWGMVLNSALILIGFIADIRIFESYRGERFGYSGLFLSPGVTSYAYLLTFFYFIVGHGKNVLKNWKFLFVFITAFLIGTKAIYLGQLVLIIYLLFEIKIKYRGAFIIAGILMGSLVVYLFFYKYGLFNQVRETEGLLSALLSFRDKLLIENTIPYVQENWSFLNYLFGGVSNYDLRSQMEVIDVFFFWGIIGGLFYLYAFCKTFVNFKLTRILLAFTLLLVSIVFLAGNFFVYSTIIIFLLILREKIMLRESSQSNNSLHGKQQGS